MRIRKNTSLFIVLLLVAMSTAMAALRQGIQSHNTSSNKSAVDQEQPTVVKDEVMSEKSREHSKLFKKEYEYRQAKSLRSIASDIKDSGEIGVIVHPPDAPALPNAPPFNLRDFLTRTACDADGIVIGSVKNKTSYLTEDETFTFTDYELTVEDILKNNAANPITSGNNITVIRPGGTIQLNGRIIRAVDKSFRPLKIGERYLLFLKLIPATGAYKALNSKGSYQITDGKIENLTEEDLPSELESGSDANLLVDNIRATIGCGK